MHSETFKKDRELPFAEYRYSTSSSSPFKSHLHSTLSIGAVSKGAVCYTVGSDSATLSPGSLALINPEILHSCNPLQSEKRSYYMLYLDVEWCTAVQNSLWNVETFISVDQIQVNDKKLYHNYCRVMQHLLSAEIHLQEKEQLLVDLVSTIFRQVCSPQSEQISRPESIEQLKGILKQDLEKDYTLNSLASVLNSNPYTLLRRFKAETGITPHAYRMNCRIEQARKFLQQGMDITETALQCGFFDQSHLHRHFKAMTTVTPQKYRLNFVQ